MASAQHHYREAKRLLAEVTTDDGMIITNVSGIASYLAAAQVQATLTVAAVAAEATSGRLVVLDPDSPSLRPHGQAMS